MRSLIDGDASRGWPRRRLASCCASAVIFAMLPATYAMAQTKVAPISPSPDAQQKRQVILERLQQQIRNPEQKPGQEIKTTESRKEPELEQSMSEFEQSMAAISQQIDQLIQQNQTSLPAGNQEQESSQPPTTEVEDKYQILLDAGIFASPGSLDMAPTGETSLAENKVAADFDALIARGSDTADEATVAAVQAATVKNIDAMAAIIAAMTAAATAISFAASSAANDIARGNTVTAIALASLSNALNPVDPYGAITPRSSWPANLNATYNGRISGALNDSSAVGGNLSMNVNFATIGSQAPIPGTIQFDNNKGNAALALVQSAGFVGGGMSGTFNNEPMTGFIRNGRFFGPEANALKGSWDMTTHNVSGGGTFSATR